MDGPAPESSIEHLPDARGLTIGGPRSTTRRTIRLSCWKSSIWRRCSRCPRPGRRRSRLRHRSSRRAPRRGGRARHRGGLQRRDGREGRGKPGWDRVRSSRTISPGRCRSPTILRSRAELSGARPHRRPRRILLAMPARVSWRWIALVSVFHPAMMLRGIQARFIDPRPGVTFVRPATATRCRTT